LPGYLWPLEEWAGQRLGWLERLGAIAEHIHTIYLLPLILEILAFEE
jgi:hypothetical protein